MKCFVAEHAFNAMEAIELSVVKGERLYSNEPSDRDGWRMVYRPNALEERGFVPTSYLREVEGPTMVLPQGSSTETEMEAAKAEEPISAPVVPGETRASSAARPAARDWPSAPSRNELEYTKLRRQREESLAYMMGRLEEALHGIHKCNDKTAAVHSALQELDTTIHRDHGQWKQLIDEEKAHLTEQNNKMISSDEMNYSFQSYKS